MLTIDVPYHNSYNSSNTMSVVKSRYICTVYIVHVYLCKDIYND